MKLWKPVSLPGKIALAAALGLALVVLVAWPVRALLEVMGFTWRPWVIECLYLTAWLCLVLLAICFIIQLFRLTGRRWTRRGMHPLLYLVGWLGGTALALALPVGCYLALLGYAFLYTPEHEVLLDGEPVVACVHSFLEEQVYAHANRGPLLMSVDYEYFDYGNGGGDPFDTGIPEPFTALDEEAGSDGEEK